MVKITSNHGILYYHEIFKIFYIKDDLNFISFQDKRVINSKYIQNQIKNIKE